jgi:hypothetical protein
MRFFYFRFALLIFQLFINEKILNFFTTDSCINGLSDFIFQIGESCLPPLPLAAGENTRNGKQKLISQNPK